MDTDKVFAITCIRNEAEIIEYTIRQMFYEGVDGMLVNLSGKSDDGTKEIAKRLAKEFSITILLDDEKHFFYRQDEITTRLANATHELGASWIVPFDADEMFYSTHPMNLAEQLRECPYNVLALRMKNYFATSQDNPKDQNPLTRLQWHKKEWNPLNKICVRWDKSMMFAVGNHHVSVDGKWLPETLLTSAEIGHFQNRSADGIVRKIRREQVQADVPNDKGIGFHRKEHAMSDDELKAWWKRDYYFDDPVNQGMVHEPAPYLRKYDNA